MSFQKLLIDKLGPHKVDEVNKNIKIKFYFRYKN